MRDEQSSYFRFKAQRNNKSELRLNKFGQSILWSLAMLKREVTFIVTMVNKMLQLRSLHGHIMEKQHIIV